MEKMIKNMRVERGKKGYLSVLFHACLICRLEISVEYRAREVERNGPCSSTVVVRSYAGTLGRYPSKLE